LWRVPAGRGRGPRAGICRQIHPPARGWRHAASQPAARALRAGCPRPALLAARPVGHFRLYRRTGGDAMKFLFGKKSAMADLAAEIVAHADDGVIVVDSDHRIVLFNASAE